MIETIIHILASIFLVSFITTIVFWVFAFAFSDLVQCKIDQTKYQQYQVGDQVMFCFIYGAWRDHGIVTSSYVNEKGMPYYEVITRHGIIKTAWPSDMVLIDDQMNQIWNKFKAKGAIK